MGGVRIQGDGVAARCCAHLLARAGVPVTFESTGRARPPAILLSEPAQALIREVFGRDDLFRDAPPIRKRIVNWGRDGGVVELDHAAVVVSEQALLESLGPMQASAEAGAEVDWSVFAAPPLPPAAAPHTFGSRMASAAPVRLKSSAAPCACWMEAVENGWLFMITVAPGAAWLLSVGTRPEEVWDQSLVITAQVEERQAFVAEFPTSPRILAPLGESGWLACGTAAMAFDPLCGDGTAHAVREAILTAAVIGAAQRGEDAARLLDHYSARLTAGFQRHLAYCRQFYASGFGGAWWDAELAATVRGLEWCERRLSGHTTFRYKLNGFNLQAIRNP